MSHALKLIAEALRKTAEKAGLPIFIGRYGGDEFTMIVRAAGEDKIGGLISILREQLEIKSEGLSYKLEASVGYEFLKDANDSAQAALKRADDKLYVDKKNNRR